MSETLIPAAVLIPLIIGDEAAEKATPETSVKLKTLQGSVLLPLATKVLLTVRTHTVEHHKGQISFPGGAFEEHDSSLLETALRESFEEVGIRKDEIEIVAELPEIPTRASLFTVRPFVGIIRGAPTLKPNPDEIGEMIFVPLSHFLDPANSNFENHEREGVNYKMKAYHYGTHRIWGVTALMLQILFEKFLIS